MNLSLPTQRLVPLALLGVLAIVFVAILAGKVGGGGDNGSSSGSATDPKAVVERAFSAQSFKSGKFNATAQVAFKGAPSPELSNVAMNFTGGFDNDPAPPKSDVDITFNVASRNVAFGAVSTGKAQYLTLGSTAYRLPPGQLDQSQSKDLTALTALGIHPQSWLVNPSYVGTASVGGVETDHVTAQVDTAKMVDDLTQLAKSGGQAGVSKANLEQAKSVVQGGAVDLYVAKSDGSLRRMSAQARVDVPDEGSKVKLGDGTVAFDMQFTEVNKPQKIAAPQGSRPISEFESAFNTQVLRSLSAPPGSKGSSPQSGSGGDAAAAQPQATLPGNAQKYLDCVEKARLKADVEKCAPLLN